MNDTVMRDAFGQLDNTAIEFICKQFGMTEEQFKALSEEQLDDLYDKLCDIELNEAPDDDGNFATESGEMATSIVTIVGNYFAEKLGYDDGDEFDRFLAESEE